MKNIPLKVFLNMLYEGSSNDKRYCFILGSGVSKSSGIPTGIELASLWLEELRNRYTDKELEDIRKELGIGDITVNSRNYFNIYDLRFYPDYQNGSAYLEKIMERAKPSPGYYPLARLLAESENNLVITTNFDSLMEDALFIYTDKKPIVVGHELLADYINMNTKRPIIAKIHRGLYFNPLNRAEDMKELSEAWKKVLKQAFRIFTPVVIGYAGGDHTLMEFLKDEHLEMSGIYWCYRGEEPDEEIQELVSNKNGMFVPISGYDEMMFMLSLTFQYDNPSERIRQVAEERITVYTEQMEQFEKRLKSLDKPSEEQEDVMKTLDASRRKRIEELQIKLQKNPAAEDYYALADEFRLAQQWEIALRNYQQALEIKPDYDKAHLGCACVYVEMKDYDTAISVYSKLIAENKSSYHIFNNRGYAYSSLKKYKYAVEDFTKALELDTEGRIAYNNRSHAYIELEEYDRAMADCNTVLALHENDKVSYNNRGYINYKKKEYTKAIEDMQKSISLDPEYYKPYKNLGLLYLQIREFQEALKYLEMALSLKQDCEEAMQAREEVLKELERKD